MGERSQGGDDRWTVELALTGLARRNFTHAHWRKSSQWVALNRKHAALVARERELLWDLGYMYPPGKEWMTRKRCGATALTICRCAARQTGRVRPGLLACDRRRHDGSPGGAWLCLVEGLVGWQTHKRAQVDLFWHAAQRVQLAALGAVRCVMTWESNAQTSEVFMRAAQSAGGGSGRVVRPHAAGVRGCACAE